MTTELQIKIGSDPMQTSFIRENPYWYKRLNRNPNSYKDFMADMKNKYKLNPSDKFNKMLNNISMIQTFLDVLK